MTALDQLAKRIEIRLGSELGSFAYNPLLGSQFHLLLRAKNEDLLEDALQYAREALQPEVDAGFVSEVREARVMEKTANYLKLEIDVAIGEKILTITREVK